MTNVLVVDDQPQLRSLMQRLLAAQGYAVRVAASGREALDAVRDGWPVDVLVTDLTMPGWTGASSSRAYAGCAA